MVITEIRALINRYVFKKFNNIQRMKNLFTGAFIVNFEQVLAYWVLYFSQQKHIKGVLVLTP